MKKITRLTTALFLLIAGWSQAIAQSIFVQEKALKAEDITVGKVIAFKGISITNTEWINWAGPSTSEIKNDGIFTVEAADGGIVLKRNTDGKYIGRSGDNIQFVDQATAAAVFTVSCPALDGTNVSGTHEVKLPEWAIDQNYQIRFTNNGSFLNVQDATSNPKGTPKFAGGKGSWSVVMVYNAEGYKAPYTVTIKKVDTKGNVISTENLSILPGEEYTVSASNINFYTFTGTVKINNEESDATSITINSDTTVEYVYNWNLPFETSNISGNEFPADTKWYLLRLRDSYIAYNSETPDEISGVSSKGYEDKYWWAFGGDAENGIKVYNKAAGAAQIMTSVSPKGVESSTYVHFENAAGLDETKNELWTIYASVNYPNDNGFYLSRKGETTKINLQNNKLVYWTGQDIGSTFRATPVTEEAAALKSSLSEATKRGAIGTLNEEAYSEFEAELAKGSVEGLRAAQAIAQNPANLTTFNPNLYYRIENLARKYSTRNASNLNDGGYLEAVDTLELPVYFTINGYFSNDRSAARAQAIWKFVATGTEGQYYLQNLNAGTYMSGKDGAYFTPGIETTEGATAFSLASLGNAQYHIKKAGSNQRLHASGASEKDGAAIMLYDGGDSNSPSAWYLIPATSIELTITDAGYATVNYPFAVQLPKELTAYTGTANAEKSKFMLEEIQNGSVPANTPVVIEGPKGIYSLTIDYENQEEPILKDLKGSLMSIEITTEDYILAKDASNIVGFYKTTEGGTLAQNKAYIESTPAIQAVRGFGFSTEGDGTTGIENTVTETEKEEYYDLQGRRILNPTKGIYVTKSGKKVLFIK